MGLDDNHFQNQLEKELENFMGQPIPDVSQGPGSGNDSDNYEEEEKKRKKKKKIKIAAIVSSVILFVALLGVYGGFTWHYSSRFFKGTTINSVDCSELTVKQAEDLIRQQVETYQLEVAFQNDEKETIKGGDINYEYVSDGSVAKLKKEQNPFLWVSNVFGKKYDYEVKANIKYSTNKLESVLAKLSQMQDANMVEPVDAKMEFVDSKFQVTPEVTGSKLDKAVVRKGIEDAISKGLEKVSIEELGAYSRPVITKEDENLNSQAQQLNTLVASSITYQLPSGDQVLDGSILKDWLTVDANGVYTKDEAAWNQHIAEYVAAMAEQVDTYDKKIKFQATNLGEVEIQGKYGFQIDQAKEVAKLTEELKNQTVATRKPVFSREALTYENNGFGSTYIEMDLSRQYLWVYQNGQVTIETGFVSGMMTADRYTPPGIFTLTYKKSPSVLRGPKKEDGTYEWESPVTYWMPFNGGIGLHDADWRAASEFGTQRYIKKGSHGCINLPVKKAEAIYNMITKDMPIILYYSEPYTVGPSTKPTSSGSSGSNATTTKTPTKAPTADPTQEPTQEPPVTDTPETGGETPQE